MESDCIREKDPPISKYQKGETRHGFLCLIFSSQKENPIVQFAMRISESFSGVVLLRNAGLRSTKTGGQLFLLDWGGGWAFISMNVKSVAMIHRQRSKLAFLNF